MNEKIPETPDTLRVETYRILNTSGMQVSFIDIGASITDIIVPDSNGNFENIVLKHDHPQSYRSNPGYLGATIGRYANRIADGTILKEGRRFALTVNETEANNHLHGGTEGFSRRRWDVKAITTDSISFEYTSPDGEQGYPGNVVAKVHYQINNDNSLRVTYEAVTDKPTIVNLTNHSYFNLSGGKENIFGHILQIFASEYTPLNERNLPLGCKIPVEGTLYDLRARSSVALVAGGIVNANYCIDAAGDLALAAVLQHTGTGREMKIYATMPGLQLYFGNFLSGSHKPFDGICLEPQYYPDAPNIPAFGYKWLNKGETYQETILYRFEA